MDFPNLPMPVDNLNKLYSESQMKEYGKKCSEYMLDSTYCALKVADHLDAIASGKYYNESALRIVQRRKNLTEIETNVLERYLTGTQIGSDHTTLQRLAIKLRDEVWVR